MPGLHDVILLTSQVSDPGSIPGPRNQRLLWGLLRANNKECRRLNSAGDDGFTLTLKLMDPCLKQRVPVAPQNGPRSRKKL